MLFKIIFSSFALTSKIINKDNSDCADNKKNKNSLNFKNQNRLEDNSNDFSQSEVYTESNQTSNFELQNTSGKQSNSSEHSNITNSKVIENTFESQYVSHNSKIDIIYDENEESVSRLDEIEQNYQSDESQENLELTSKEKEYYKYKNHDALMDLANVYDLEWVEEMSMDELFEFLDIADEACKERIDGKQLRDILKCYRDIEQIPKKEISK